MIMTEEIRINYILVGTGDTNRLDLSTFVEDFQLTNVVVESTRGDRVFDVMLTNRPRYYSVDVVNSTVQSGHKTIYAKPTQLYHVSPIRRMRHFLDRRRQNKEALQKAILGNNWAVVLEQDLDNAYTQFTVNVLAEIHKNIPVIKMNMSDRAPQYVSRLIKTLLKRRARYFRQRRLRDANNLSDRIGNLIARNRASELAKSSHGTQKWWQKV